MLEIPELDEALRGGDPLAAAARDVVGRMIQLAVRDAKDGCEKSAKWLVSPEAAHWLEMIGVDRSYFFDLLRQQLEGDKGMRTGRTDKRTYRERRRDESDRIKRESRLRREAAESQHQEAAQASSEHVMADGLFPRAEPSFGSAFASHMSLLADGLSGDLDAQRQYKLEGATGQQASQGVAPSKAKHTKDVKDVDTLADKFKAALGPAIHAKQVFGATSWEDLEARREAQEQVADMESLLRDFSTLVDNIMLADVDKPAAVSDAANGLQSRFKQRNPSKGLAAHRQLKAKTRKLLHQKGLTW